MNFAKEQLLKHGWKQGQGLGKDESGIKEPVKAKIKHDTTGVGHDAGKEFTFHWWDHMFNKAASNIQVETTENGVQVKKGESSGKVKTAKTYDNKALLYNGFVKGATLSDGRYKAEEKVTEQEDSDHEQPSKSSIIPANEEELFKQCGGRTAHKGARHGLKLNGKLARIEQQEQELLDRRTKKSANQAAGNGHVTVSTANGQNSANGIDGHVDSNQKQKKKKKRKHVETIADEREEGMGTTDQRHTKTYKKKRKKDKNRSNDGESCNSDIQKQDLNGQLGSDVHIHLRSEEKKNCSFLKNRNSDQLLQNTFSEEKLCNSETDNIDTENTSKKAKKKKKKKKDKRYP